MKGMWKFLAVGLGLVVAAYAGVDAYAKCRCGQDGCNARGARKAARQERRACKRGVSTAVYPAVPNGGGQQQPTYYNPYGTEGVNKTWGAQAGRVGCVEKDSQGKQYTVTSTWLNRYGQAWEQHCYGTYCVNVPAPPPVPVVQPIPPAPPIAPKAEEKAPAPPEPDEEVSVKDTASAAPSTDPAADWFPPKPPKPLEAEAAVIPPDIVLPNSE